MTGPAPYIPLRNLSGYTMLEGAIEPKALAKAARERGHPAIGLCDRNGLYGAMAFTQACRDAGVQPVIGAFLCVARPALGGGEEPKTVPGRGPTLDWLALFAMDEAGYANLSALVSAAHLERPDHLDPFVPLEAVEARAAGLMCLTGGGEGALARLLAEGQADHAEAYLSRLKAAFGDRLAIELSRRGDAAETAAESALVAIADRDGLPLVATNPAAFLEPDFQPAHDVMLCIAQSAYVDTADRRRSSAHLHLKSQAVMREAFADLPDAVENTARVAARCAAAAPFRQPILPSIAGDRAGEEAMLRADATAGLNARLARMGALSDADRQRYHDRLTYELDVIVRMGFPGYFLIVADFIKWAKEQGIPVGPGRGSGAGSVVAWALTITDLDPLQLDLLFERFLNPDRVSMPDFDIDFCETRRGEVIRYVQERYGRDTVAQIITFGTMKARAVLKDTGRVLQMSYNQVDRLAKHVPINPIDPWTLRRSLDGVAELAGEYRRDADVRRLVDMALKLEGLPRHSSTHAAGVVIGDRPLVELVPLYRDPRSDMPVTQFDMKNVETAGLVKFDFLGLKTLSVLHEACRLLSLRGIDCDLAGLSWDDPAVYQLLQRGDTVGVFQLESEGMRRALAAVRPTCFADIIALVSLYRPGPMDQIPLFGARKNGREPVAYPHPLLEDILAETQGIIVYQEQVMQAVQVLAGFSLSEADLLRRAMGKKNKAEALAQQERFLAGCAANGIDKAKGEELFALILKFADYGFNKSHAAAYSLLAYQTAWLKAHHPHEFFAASMTFDAHLTDKLSVFVDDMRRLGVALAPPCVNNSDAEFTVEQAADGSGLQVRYALGALKGVGEKVMETLAAERRAHGDFASLDDFARRVDAKLLNKRQVEALAGAGAFDCLGDDRAVVHGAADVILGAAGAASDQRATGQGGLFGEEADVDVIQLPEVAPWPLGQRMAREKEAFGFYFSAHPTEQYDAILAARGVRTFGEWSGDGGLVSGTRTPATLAGLIEAARYRTSQRGNRYLVLTLSDRSGQYSASCFDEDAARGLEALAEEGGCGLLSVELDLGEGEEVPRVTVRGVQPLAAMDARQAVRLAVTITRPEALAALAALVAPRRDPSAKGELIALCPAGEGRMLPVRLGQDFHLDADTRAGLAAIPGIAAVELSPVRRAAA